MVPERDQNISGWEVPGGVWIQQWWYMPGIIASSSSLPTLSLLRLAPVKLPIAGWEGFKGERRLETLSLQKPPAGYSVSFGHWVENIRLDCRILTSKCFDFMLGCTSISMHYWTVQGSGFQTYQGRDHTLAATSTLNWPPQASNGSRSYFKLLSSVCILNSEVSSRAMSEAHEGHVGSVTLGQFPELGHIPEAGSGCVRSAPILNQMNRREGEWAKLTTHLSIGLQSTVWQALLQKITSFSQNKNYFAGASSFWGKATILRAL